MHIAFSFHASLATSSLGHFLSVSDHDTLEEYGHLFCRTYHLRLDLSEVFSWFSWGYEYCACLCGSCQEAHDVSILVLVMLTLITWLKCHLQNFITIFFLSNEQVGCRRYFEAMQITCFSSYYHSWILASSSDSCSQKLLLLLQQLLLWCLPNGHFLFPSLCLHLLIEMYCKEICPFSPMTHARVINFK